MGIQLYFGLLVDSFDIFTSLFDDSLHLLTYLAGFYLEGGLNQNRFHSKPLIK